MSLKEILLTIIYLGHFILALNTFLYFKSFRKKTIAFKIITFYLLYVLTIELRMSFLSSHKEMNLHYTHFYFIGQFILLSFFYLQKLKSKLISKSIKIYLILALGTLATYYYLNPNSFYQHNIIEILITSIPLIIYSFIFLAKKIDSLNKDFIYLNSGLFVYILCSTLIFIAGNLKSDIKLIIWLFNAILYSLYQLLITLDWYKNFRRKKISL